MDFYAGPSNSSLFSSRLPNLQVGSTSHTSSDNTDTMTEARRYTPTEALGRGNDDNTITCSSTSTALSSTISHSKISPETVQRAAAALNIPWTKSLEDAVLARSLLTSLPLPLTPASAGTAGSALESGSSLGSSCALSSPGSLISSALDNPSASGLQASMNETPTHTLATTLSTSISGNHHSRKMVPKQDASINVGFYPSDHEMDNSSSHSMPTSPSGPTSNPTSPTMPSLPPFIERDYALMGTNVLSTQTQLPISSTKSIQATTYKSSYRTSTIAPSRRDWRHSTGTITHAGSSHKERQSEEEEPPSVLEGRDIQEMDEATLKRAKNTDAARRSRHKKQMRMDGLDQRVSELEVENAMFENKLNEVELERSILLDKNQTQQARIQELELMVVALQDQIMAMQSSRS
ncbi:hypothetical protein BGW38_010603 [Lunasporangiospora selenospora]|uniref:BZIP domain-containing protein n=1 Tax=Lunasporangiospora selenospora TaxID=979761 RepID=A0A9P6FWA8_9FUNG|nr:hypothetical protein BGW38_010603 [Lunasporangiospora selenospora]